MDKYTILKNSIRNNGMRLLTSKDDYKTTKQMVIVTDGNYKTLVKAENYINQIKRCPSWFAVKNPFLIENVNKFYEINNNGSFICISKDNPKTRDDVLRFQCTRCGEIIEKSLFNAIRRDDSHHGIQCPNCDEHLESIHALVLKQMFNRYYPDSIEEDPSCINPKTGAIMPTDIVNHRLKIAVEIQGQWHRFEGQKERDRIKKDFWLSKGYSFYDYEIDGVSVLDYVRYFFPGIEEIPDWVNMDYNKKLNLKVAQQLLDNGLKVAEVAERMNVHIYRLYDALHSNKLYYPNEYIKSTRQPVVMLDRNRKYIREYDSYTLAEEDNNIKKGLIASCIYYKKYYSSGYYWIPKDLYWSGNYKIPTNRTDKFYFPVVKYDLNGTKLATFEDMYQAAKDIGTIAHKIYVVANGQRKSVKGFAYKYK